MIIYSILFCILMLSLVSDLKKSKIHNFHVVFAILAGISLNFMFSGVNGLNSSAKGIIFPIIFLGVFFFLRLIGAGDIKLFSAIGALLGWKYGLYIMAYSFIFSAVFSVIYLIWVGEMKGMINEFILDIKCLLLTKDFKLLEYNRKRHVIKMTPAIVLGVFVQLYVSN